MDTLTESLHQLERQAATEHELDRNAAALQRLCGVAALASAVGALSLYAFGEGTQALVALTNLILLVLLLARSTTEPLLRRPRVVALTVLLVESAVLLLLLWDLPPFFRLLFSGLLLPLCLLLFRLRTTDLALVLVPLWAATCWIWSTELSGLWRAPQGLGGLIWPTAVLAAIAAGATNLNRYRRQRFTEGWRRVSSLDRERERMREEIESARQVQLSMLPRVTPHLSWLDVAGVSMPAHEVGGDYYDYFLLDEDRLSLVIGDVAGHGLPSGLLLSGLRSCLYLLRAELGDPARVLARLDDMVRHTTGRRMLVTLQAATFEPEGHRLVLANAGHPAPLLFSAKEHQTRELDQPALPLGTRLGATYRQDSVPLALGDVLLFYSDGLVETLNGQGEPYGSSRLLTVFSRAAIQKTALDVRNHLLADLANYKGDHRRGDDVTLVVLRVV
ncbi:MAG TPA: PP2C family protein-serine/threonine phosphatase [Thermoanaerobaculia bacterium]|nr:PP2C family protein-serine/threonine phosphatase [Thermoanaerobaculia bacterium]